MHDITAPLTLAGIDNDIVPVLALSIGGGIAFIAIVFGTFKQIVTNASREKTRREVAAYVAEGTMAPEDAERILTAGRRYESDNHT